jgi:hypothetical protein
MLEVVWKLQLLGQPEKATRSDFDRRIEETKSLIIARTDLCDRCVVTIGDSRESPFISVNVRRTKRPLVTNDWCVTYEQSEWVCQRTFKGDYTPEHILTSIRQVLLQPIVSDAGSAE